MRNRTHGRVEGYWVVFLKGPFGSMVELHQLGTCRCRRARRPSAAAAMS
jgi:hypothetical protein